MTVFLLSTLALAQVDPNCDQLVQPENYDEQVQQDFLSNYVALATSFSPLHGPVPHEGGRGSIGVDLAIIPPLGCGQRYVLDWTKTEDTNKSPVAPRPVASFTFPPLFDLIYPYAGVGFVPPVPLGGTRNLILSGEFGVGLYATPQLSVGARAHGTLVRTFGDVATAFEETAPAYGDLYVSSAVGGDLLVGYQVIGGSAEGPTITPYISVGLTDVTTFFWIGDDSLVTNNYHPYFGPAISIGADALLWNRVRVGAEAFIAPGGHSLPDKTVSTVEDGAFSRYGNLTTGRLRLTYEL